MKLFTFNRLKNLLLISTATLVLAACSGGGGSSTTSSSLSGVASKGLVNGGTVTAYSVVNGAKGTALATTTTDSQGKYTLPISNYSGAVLVEITGGTYTDEATGTTTPLAAPLRSLVANASGTISLSITPFSEALTQNTLAAAGGLTAANITAAITAATTQLGFDPVATQPGDATDVSSATASAAAKAYAFYLGAVSQYLTNNPSQTLEQAITDLADAITHSTLSSNVAFTTAQNDFGANPHNKTGVADAAGLQTVVSAIGSGNSGSSSGGTSGSGTLTITPLPTGLAFNVGTVKVFTEPGGPLGSVVIKNTDLSLILMVNIAKPTGSSTYNGTSINMQTEAKVNYSPNYEWDTGTCDPSPCLDAWPGVTVDIVGKSVSFDHVVLQNFSQVNPSASAVTLNGTVTW